MSIITLRTNAEFTWLELGGHQFFITPNHDLAEETCLRCCEDLEFLRETVISRINAIRYQSDDHADVKESKIDKLRNALENVGVPMCDDIVEVDYDGFVLMVGINVERAEECTNTPASVEIMSITHRGADAMLFIDTIGGDEAFEDIVDRAFDKWSGK